MEIRTHNARTTDPESSHLASEQVTRSGRRQQRIATLVTFVRKHPGLTSREISLALNQPDLDRVEVARRLADAKGVQLKQGPLRSCTACSGMTRCKTWWPIEYDEKLMGVHRGA